MALSSRDGSEMALSPVSPNLSGHGVLVEKYGGWNVRKHRGKGVWGLLTEGRKARVWRRVPPGILTSRLESREFGTNWVFFFLEWVALVSGVA